MILFILFLSFLLLASGYTGYRQIIRLEHLNRDLFINGLLVAFIILTVMSVIHWLGILSQFVAARITMSAYTIAGGFFMGYSFKLLKLRSIAGNLEYMYRSFWTDVAPNLIAIALFVFGIYRTGLLDWGYFTGIGITSGISLIGFSFLGWTIHVVPEFRFKGILVLDHLIKWKNIVAYRWIDENTMQIDYMTESRKISEFKTFIPSEDQLIIERLLGGKLKEHEEERKQMMLEQKDSP